ncbi:MAG: septal ring lytic transglycosylase RlpA family protein [Desulfobacterales bacterium]|nr:septal ring lytic transglycosylase RlpA family protein [Desulfobacterales bacterium]
MIKKNSFYIFLTFLAVCGLLFFVFGCSKTKPPQGIPGYPKPYKVMGKWYQPIPHSQDFSQSGKASWYGSKFHGRKTANGETYNMYAMTAAHKTLPLGTCVRVKNLQNNKEIDVRINDRGPFVRGRIIDLSYTGAKKLGIVGPGTAPVQITALGIPVLSTATAEKDSGPSYVPIDYYKGDFTIQIGAFTNRNNAERLKQKLDLTYKNAHIMIFNNGTETFYRVRVGRCSTLQQAIEYENKLIENGFKGAFAVAE